MVIAFMPCEATEPAILAAGENGADFLPFNYMKKSDALNGKSLSSSNGATNY